MQTENSPDPTPRGLASAAIRLLLIALAGAEWLALWTVVYLPQLGR